MLNLFALILFAATVSLAGCGGGGSDSAASINSAVLPTTGNVQPLTVDAGPANNSANGLYTSVTICAPGGVVCQTIDHILVDTGSSGLRIMASLLSSSLALPAQTDNALNPLGECFQFADGSTWGPIKLADVRMAGQQANSVPIQVIGDPGFSAVPADCPSPFGNTVAAFRANGILGVSVFRQDYGPLATLGIPGLYYICPLGVCQSVGVSLQKQVQNPVSMFATDKNGVIIRLPSIPQEGARRVSGSLIFGIGTQANNGLGGANIISVNPNTGFFVTSHNGINYNSSFIDSGSNGIFFTDPGIPVCSSNFYCPPSTLNFSVINHGTVNSIVNFNVANADSLFAANPAFTAFTSLAGPNSFTNSFDFGLSFFYGRDVYTAIEGMSTGGGNVGPYVAY